MPHQTLPVSRWDLFQNGPLLPGLEPQNRSLNRFQTFQVSPRQAGTNPGCRPCAAPNDSSPGTEQPMSGEKNPPGSAPWRWLAARPPLPLKTVENDGLG